jgi:hypothetical protein
MLLSIVGNRINSGNNVVRAGMKQLAGRLPSGWKIAEAPSVAGRLASAGVDAVVRIRGPESNPALVFVAAKRQLEPKEVDSLAAQLPIQQVPLLVVAPFLSPRTQEKLRMKGIGYADLTGNVRLSLSRPGLFIETRGADKNPEPARRERRSLKGAKAGRLIRALCDFRPPLGLRELAKRAGVDPGYTSRIVTFLDREALVVRDSRGHIKTVDWPALLRRWSQDYSPFQKGRVQWFLAARGLGQLMDRLRSIATGYVVSGSWAAGQFAPVAPSRLLLCYADEPLSFSKALNLRPSDAGSNVVLASPFDRVVSERTLSRRGIAVAAPSQVVVDLLTSPGRGPNEAEALIEWMRENESVWRT